MAPLKVIGREWLRIGLTGFGGPPPEVIVRPYVVVPDCVAACVQWLQLYE